ncbi:MAG: sensor histidine kinase, partial [Thermomicrobiales bacterium]
VLPLHREAVDCGAFVAEVNAGFAPEAARRGIHLTSDVSFPGTMRIDPVRIREVLGNLVANAIRYTPSGGAISVLARCGEDSADFSVADTGPGIAPDQLPRSFDRFTKSADSGGSGLGLAIAKSLVEAHGGSISAESAPGSGTTIRFSLPSHGGNGE